MTGGATAGDAPVHIQLKVKDQQGSELQFKIKKSTQLRKLTKVYCSRMGLQSSQVRFMVDGERIGPEDSAEKFGHLDIARGAGTYHTVTRTFAMWRTYRGVVPDFGCRPQLEGLVSHWGVLVTGL